MRPKQAFYALSGVLAVIILACGFGVYSMLQRISDESNKVSILKADEQVLQEQIRIYQQEANLVEQLSDVQILADQVLPEEKSQSEAIVEVTNFANELGLPLTGIDFSGTTDQENPDISQTEGFAGVTGVRTLNAQLSFDINQTNPVPYSSILAFLEKIENNQRKIQVSSISLEPGNDRNTITALQLSIRFFLRG